MSLYNRETAPRDDDPDPAADIRAAAAAAAARSPSVQSSAPRPPLRLRRLHRELTRLHVRSAQRAPDRDYTADDAGMTDDGGLVRKSGRIRERDRLTLSGFEKTKKPLFLYDASFLLRDDVSRSRRRKVT